MSLALGFAQGLNNQREENRRTRREIAEAFAQFRERNPYATLAEMQEYIDGQTGGLNYLRGGAPSNQILQSIAQDNQSERERRDAQRVFDDLQRDNQQRQLIEDAAYNFVINNDADSGEAYHQQFMADNGYTEEQMASLGFTGMFGDDNIQRFRNRRAAEVLPEINLFLESTDGNITNEDLYQQFPNASRTILDGALATAQRLRDVREEDRRLNLHYTRQQHERAGRAAVGQALTGLNQDPIYQNLVELGQFEEASEHALRVLRSTTSDLDIETFFNGVPIEQIAANPQEYLADTFNNSRTAMSMDRRRARQERRSQLRSAAEENRASIIETGIDFADEAHPDDPVMRTVAQNIANEAGYTRNMQFEAEHLIATDPTVQAARELNDPQTLQAALLQNPRFQRAVQLNAARLAGPDVGLGEIRQERFDVWEERFENEVNEDVAGHRASIALAARQDPIAAREALVELRQFVDQDEQRSVYDIRERADDPFWVDPGGAPHDLGRLQDQEDNIRSSYALLRGEITEALNALPQPEAQDTRITRADLRGQRAERRADRDSRDSIFQEMRRANLIPSPVYGNAQMRDDHLFFNDNREAIVEYLASLSEDQRRAFLAEHRGNRTGFLDALERLIGDASRYDNTVGQ